jgi:hypothetical protein
VQAGRYHSVYGSPQGLAGIVSPESAAVRAEIGPEADRLVRLWSQVDRTAIVEAAPLAARSSTGDAAARIPLKLAGGGETTVSRDVYLDLAHLHVANSLEHRMRVGKRCDHIEPLRAVLRPEATAVLERHQRSMRHRRRSRRSVIHRRLRGLFAGRAP